MVLLFGRIIDISAADELGFWKNYFFKKMGIAAVGALIVTVNKNRTGDCFSLESSISTTTSSSLSIRKTWPSATLSTALEICFSATSKAFLVLRSFQWNPSSPYTKRRAIRRSAASRLWPVSSLVQPRSMPLSRISQQRFQNRIVVLDIEERPAACTTTNRISKRRASIKTTSASHTTSFSGPISLSTPSDAVVYNVHHMRLYNFARDNDALLEVFIKPSWIKSRFIQFIRLNCL